MPFGNKTTCRIYSHKRITNGYVLKGNSYHHSVTVAAYPDFSKQGLAVRRISYKDNCAFFEDITCITYRSIWRSFLFPTSIIGTLCKKIGA